MLLSLASIALKFVSPKLFLAAVCLRARTPALPTFAAEVFFLTRYDCVRPLSLLQHMDIALGEWDFYVVCAQGFVDDFAGFVGEGYLFADQHPIGHV